MILTDEQWAEVEASYRTGRTSERVAMHPVIKKLFSDTRLELAKLSPATRQDIRDAIKERFGEDFDVIGELDAESRGKRGPKVKWRFRSAAAQLRKYWPGDTAAGSSRDSSDAPKYNDFVCWVADHLMRLEPMHVDVSRVKAHSALKAIEREGEPGPPDADREPDSDRMESWAKAFAGR